MNRVFGGVRFRLFQHYEDVRSNVISVTMECNIFRKKQYHSNGPIARILQLQRNVGWYFFPSWTSFKINIFWDDFIILVQM